MFFFIIILKDTKKKKNMTAQFSTRKFPKFRQYYRFLLRLKIKQLCPVTLRQRPHRMQYVLEVLTSVAETCLNLKINLVFQFILRPSLVFTAFTTFVVGYYYVLDQVLSTCLTCWINFKERASRVGYFLNTTIQFALRPQYVPVTSRLNFTKLICFP